MRKIVHDKVFRPAAEGSPSFGIQTWYEGVSVASTGQSSVKLGYRLVMDSSTVFEGDKEADFFRPNPRNPADGPQALIDLLGHLTSAFQVIAEIEKLEAQESPTDETKARIQTLERYLNNLTPFWNCVVGTFGEELAGPRWPT